MRNFIQGIKNIVYWFPVIWKDRNWDTYYIYEVLKHKLKAQSQYIGVNDRHTRAQQDARNMRICASLIQKCQDEFYSIEYLDYEDWEYEFESYDEDQEYFTFTTKTISENLQDYFDKYPLIYKRVLNGEGPFKVKDKEDKHRIALNIANINQDRARKLLFKIMEQNIEGWWD